MTTHSPTRRVRLTDWRGGGDGRAPWDSDGDDSRGQHGFSRIVSEPVALEYALCSVCRYGVIPPREWSDVNPRAHANQPSPLMCAPPVTGNAALLLLEPSEMLLVEQRLASTRFHVLNEQEVRFMGLLGNSCYQVLSSIKTQ
jgi:hypothetical protein